MAMCLGHPSTNLIWVILMEEYNEEYEQKEVERVMWQTIWLWSLTLKGLPKFSNENLNEVAQIWISM